MVWPLGSGNPVLLCKGIMTVIATEHTVQEHHFDLRETRKGAMAHNVPHCRRLVLDRLGRRNIAAIRHIR